MGIYSDASGAPVTATYTPDDGFKTPEHWILDSGQYVDSTGTITRPRADLEKKGYGFVNKGTGEVFKDPYGKTIKNRKGSIYWHRYWQEGTRVE